MNKIFTNLMLDIETLGNKPTSVITTIGAVAFNLDGSTGPEFLIHVDAQDCLDKGLTVDASTIMWWLAQSEDARQLIIDGQNRENKPHRLDHALYELGAFIASLNPSTLRVWGNSARFDLGIIHNACMAVRYKGIDGLPWLHRMERDVRTMVDINPPIKQKWLDNFKGIKHDPIADCKCQIGYVSEIAQGIIKEVVG